MARGADALLVLTEWNDFRQLDWERVQKEMARPLVLDARNMLSPAEMKALGFEYHSFGRPDLSGNTGVRVVLLSTRSTARLCGGIRRPLRMRPSDQLSFKPRADAALNTC